MSGRPRTKRGRPRKLPPEAFEFFAALPLEERNYQAVADHFRCTTRTVSALAIAEDWAGRVAEVDAERAHAMAERAAESREQFEDRFLHACRVAYRRALTVLETLEPTDYKEAIDALDKLAKIERQMRRIDGSQVNVTIEQRLESLHAKLVKPAEVRPRLQIEVGESEDDDE